MSAMTSFGTGGVHMAIDEQGNPVCAGGLSGCMCPPDDPRIATPESLADARERMSVVLDHLERVGHSLTCRCEACEADHVLRNGLA